MRIALVIAFLCLPGLAQASSFMRVDVVGSVDRISSGYTGPVDVEIGDPFSVTGYFDMSVTPTVTSTPENTQYGNIGVAMFANLGGYHVVHGTPVAPVPITLHNRYANASVHDYDPPSTSGIGFNFSATSAGLLNGFSPYYVAVSGRDEHAVGLGDMLFTADKFTAANLAGMEETRVDFSLHNGATVLRIIGEIDSWSARYVDVVPDAPAVPLPATGVLLLAALAGGAAVRQWGLRGAASV
jgi:hypothetical protein